MDELSFISFGGKRNANGQRERERESFVEWAVADPDGFDVLESKCAAGAGFTRHCQP